MVEVVLVGIQHTSTPPRVNLGRDSNDWGFWSPKSHHNEPYMALSWIMYYSVGDAGGSPLSIAAGYGKYGVGHRITHLYSQKFDCWLDGGTCVLSLSRDYHMINLYGKYFCLLDLVITVSSISFQLRVNSALPLLDDLEVTVNNPCRFSEAINHYIKTANPIQKIKSRIFGFFSFL